MRRTRAWTVASLAANGRVSLSFAGVAMPTATDAALVAKFFDYT